MRKQTFAAIVAVGTLVCGASAAPKNYLHFTARGGSVQIGMVDYYAEKSNPTPPLSLEWTRTPDKEPWTLFASGTTTLALGEGESAYFRQHDSERKTVTRDGYTYGWSFTMTSDETTPTATVEAGGNCLSIIDASCSSDSVGTNALSRLFANCSILVTPPELPATRLARCCYMGMFKGCSALVRPPELPAQELDESCYSSMFSGCASLAYAPALPATELAKSCYYSMFEKCTSLESAPHLPAATLPTNCYNSMFDGCAKLRRISVAFTTWQTDHSQTTYWLRNVAQSGCFIKPSSLPATTGSNMIPEGWSVAQPVKATVPHQANCTALASADGATFSGTANGDATVFIFGKGSEDAVISFEPSDGYQVVGAAEYAIPNIASAVTLGTGSYPLPTLVRMIPEVDCPSAALQYDGLEIGDGCITLSFGVKVTTGLDGSAWQQAAISDAALSDDGKTVTLTIPTAAAQGFYRLNK